MFLDMDYLGRNEGEGGRRVILRSGLCDCWVLASFPDGGLRERTVVVACSLPFAVPSALMTCLPWSSPLWHHRL